MTKAISILWFFIFTCSANEDTHNFEKYLESLTSLATPVVFAKQDDIYLASPNFDSLLFQTFKHRGTQFPFGKLFEEDSIVITIEIILADYSVPVVMTYDRIGNKLDSLTTFSSTGTDLGYRSYETVAITDQKEIVVIDSTWICNSNETETETIHGAEQLYVTTALYRVDNKGKIKRTTD